MNHRILAVIVIVIALVGASFGYVSMKEDTDQTPSTENKTTATEARVAQAADRPIRADAYVDYSDDVIAKTPGTKLLFFHAPWCPQCRALDKDITAADIPDDVTVIRVDYDSRQDLRQKYGVTIQTTVVRVDDDGNLVHKYVAYDNPTFDALKVQLLAED